jgi:hypothetical protein
MRVDTIIIFGILIILIILDITYKIDVTLVHFIFLSAMVLYDGFVLIRERNKIKENKINIYKFRNTHWLSGLISWVVVAYLFLANDPIDLYMVIKCILLLILILIFIKKEIQDIYFINQDVIKNFRTSKIVKLSDITNIQFLAALYYIHQRKIFHWKEINY